MPSTDDIIQKCCTISEVPCSFDRSEVSSHILKKRPSSIVSNIGTVEGGEADSQLQRWVVCFSSTEDAEYFYRDVQHEEVEAEDGEWSTWKFLETVACEIPNDWLGMDDDDLESDGDPEQPPQPPEKTRKWSGPSQQLPPHSEGQPFAMSGFYQNIPGSGPPGQPNQGPGPGLGFQQPFFRPPMGQMPGGYPPSMPQGPPGQQGPQGPQGPGQPFYGQFPPVRYDEQTKQWVPNMPMFFDEKTGQLMPMYHMPPGGPHLGFPGPEGGSHLPGFSMDPRGQGPGRGSPPPYNSGEMGSDNTPSYNRTNVKESHTGPSHAVRDQEEYMEKLRHKIDQENKAQGTTEEPQEEQEKEEAPRTKIVVGNLPSTVDEEYLEMLFENKKKQGGGPVAAVELDTDLAQAIVEFEEPEAVDIVLGKMPIQIKGKELSIEVYVAQPDPGHTQDEAQDEDPTKILVTNIPSSVDDDFVALFFENTKKCGGGPVVDVELNEEDGVAIVEFAEPKSVQIVLDKLSKQAFVMSGSKVNIKVYVPEVERDEAEDLVGGEDEVKKILVTNVPAKALDEEYLEMFFERHGGDIFHIKLFEEYSAAVIEFDEAAVIDKIMGKQPLRMFKMDVEVRHYNPRYVARDTVEVRGQGLERDYLEMYFESKKRSEGGNIVNLDLNEDEGEVAYIQFESEEVASRVVDRGNHSVARQTLSVAIYQPQDPLQVYLKKKAGISEDSASGQTDHSGDKRAKSKAKGAECESAPKASPIVKVRGMKRVKSRDTVQYYFENKRRSGGGEIEEIKNDEEDDNVAFINFKSAEAASAVAERGSHTVDNCELVVSLYTPPPPRPLYEDRLLIRGVKHTTTKDCLFNFLENKSGGAIPEEQQQGEKEDVRLVTFQTPIDFDRLKKNAQRLEGASLQLEQVSVSNCIYVANYDESLGKDTIELYFENTNRSGGGQVEKVWFNENEGYWLIYFADYKVIDEVLHREHKLGQNKLVVQLFVDCLGRPQGGDGEFRFKAPEPVLVPEPNTQKIKFILSSGVSKQAIEVQMESVYTRINWPNKSDKPPLQVKLECTLTQKVQNSYKLAKDWKQIALKNFQDYLKTIAVMQNNVRTELWSDVVKTLQEITIDNPDAVAVFVEKDQGLVTVVGVKKAAENLSSEIKQRIKAIEEAADLAKQRIKEVVTNLKLIETKMLLAIKYPTKMEEKYKDLKVKINQNKNELTFDGLGRDIQAAKLDMYEMKNSFCATVCKDVPMQSLGMYQLKQVKEYIVKSLKQRNVPAVWDVDNEELIICSASEGTLAASVQTIRGAVKENSVALSKASRSIVNTDEWDHMTQDTQARYPGRAMITVTDMSAVVITTTDDVEQDVLGVVKKFLSANAILDEKVQLTSSVSKLLSQHHRNQVDDIAKSLVGDHVQIIWNKGGFDIRGNEKGVAKAQSQLRQLASKVKSKDHEIKKPGLGEYMTQHQGRENMGTVENQLPCVIRIKGEEEEEDIYGDDDTDAGYSEGRIPLSGPALPRGMRLHATCPTPDDRMIFTVEGDMTEMAVDVLVNTADKKLSLAGGLGKVIVSKGGKEVKDACAEYIRRYQTLEEGDVFLSPGGNLKAGQVIHVVGPAWQSGNSREKDRLKEAVGKVMKQASLKGVKSIAIPAIGCGTFGFPSKVATSVIVQAVQNYFREEQDCSIQFVYLCDVKPETIDGFTDALQTCFGRVRIAPSKPRGGSAPSHAPGSGFGRGGGGAKPKPKPRAGAVPVLPTALPPGKPPGTKVVIGNIKVTIVKGEIAKEKVNAIVNTTADNLDLNNGAVSKSLLMAAGPELQNEVKAKHPDKLKFGEIVKTQGHNLACDLVMHTALPNYDGGPAVKILQNVMDKCLTEAGKQNFTKVAFPAIGTGNLKFPRDVVAKEMFGAVEAFTQKSANSSITEVRFVVYHKDTVTVKAFEAEESKWLSGSRVVAQRRGRDFGGPTYQNLQETADDSDEEEEERVDKDFAGLGLRRAQSMPDPPDWSPDPYVTFSPGNSHVQIKLLRNLLNPLHWLEDEHMDWASKIVRKKFTNFDGLEDVCVVLTGTGRKYKNPFIQVLNSSQNHWITVTTVNCAPGVVRLYDSYYKRPVASVIQNILEMLTFDPISLVTIDRARFQLQNNKLDCGLYAVAAMFSLVSGKDPSQEKYDRLKMREHLFTCLDQNSFIEFPQYDGDITQRKQEYIQVFQCCECKGVVMKAKGFNICEGCQSPCHPVNYADPIKGRPCCAKVDGMVLCSKCQLSL